MTDMEILFIFKMTIRIGLAEILDMGGHTCSHLQKSVFTQITFEAANGLAKLN